MKTAVFIFFGVLALVGLAFAQNPPNAPYWPLAYLPPATTLNGNASGTITTTSTFQQVFAANSLRKGCRIQNNGAAAMYVAEGVTAAAATTAGTGKAFQIPSGSTPPSTFYCENYGAVLTGIISITGTTTQAFYAVQY